MDRGQLITVNGKIYEYDRYDKHLDIHFVSEVEIDEEGYLTATYVPCCFSTEGLKNDETHFTQHQWCGIVAHFIREGNFHLNEEEIENATEDIVGRCFAYGIPKMHELADYIAEYMDR